nr:uncharacterized protein LOC127334673 [Lolium perenne]
MKPSLAPPCDTDFPRHTRATIRARNRRLHRLLHLWVPRSGKVSGCYSHLPAPWTLPSTSWSQPCPSSTSSTMSARTPRTPSTSASWSGLLAFASSRIGLRSGVVRYDKFSGCFSASFNRYEDMFDEDNVSKVTLPAWPGQGYGRHWLSSGLLVQICILSVLGCI